MYLRAAARRYAKGVDAGSSGAKMSDPGNTTDVDLSRTSGSASIASISTLLGDGFDIEAEGQNPGATP